MPLKIKGSGMKLNEGDLKIFEENDRDLFKKLTMFYSESDHKYMKKIIRDEMKILSN